MLDSGSSSLRTPSWSIRGTGSSRERSASCSSPIWRARSPSVRSWLGWSAGRTLDRSAPAGPAARMRFGHSVASGPPSSCWATCSRARSGGRWSPAPATAGRAVRYRGGGRRYRLRGFPFGPRRRDRGRHDARDPARRRAPRHRCSWWSSCSRGTCRSDPARLRRDDPGELLVRGRPETPLPYVIYTAVGTAMIWLAHADNIDGSSRARSASSTSRCSAASADRAQRGPRASSPGQQDPQRHPGIESTRVG